MPAYININVAGKEYLVFGGASIQLVRGENNDVTDTITFSNGTGQVMTPGEVLYTTGTPGTPGYLQVTMAEATAVTLTGSGDFDIRVISLPTATATDFTLEFDYDLSPIEVVIDYVSDPVVEDITINILNRDEHIFTVSDFTDKFSDFDGDTLSEVGIFTNVTNYKYNTGTVGSPIWIDYVLGTWMTTSEISEGRLKLVGPNVNTPHNQSSEWKAKDSSGRISQ